jgi:CAAX protease family protein
LMALLATHGVLAAILISSIVFGLWHIGPTIQTVLANRPNVSRSTLVKITAGAVVFATIGGLILGSLRFITGSLAAPFALHATFNALATLAAWIACRRVPVIVEA